MRLFAILGLLALVLPSSPSSPSPVVVLNHVSVLDVEAGALLPDRAVVLAGDRIQEVVPATGYSPPRGAEIVDLTGRYLAPGFIEMHAHVFSHPWDEKGELMPRFDRSTLLETLRLMLAHGITTVRDPGAPTEAAVTLRGMLAAGEVAGPALLTAGRIINGSTFNPEPFSPIANEAQVREEVRWQAAAGVDFIKIYASMTPDLTRAAIDEAHAHGLPVIGHLARTTWKRAAELGIDAITHGASWSPEDLPEAARANYQQSMFGRVYWLEHLDLDSPPAREMVDALVRHRVTIDPTLIAYHTKFFGNDPRWVQHPQLNLAPELYRRGWPKGSFTASWTDEQYRLAKAQWPKMQALTKRLFDKGVLLTVGTDTPTPWIIPGLSFHEEMQLLVDTGIPTADVLRMATLNGAKALGKKDRGAVKPGLRADLVVLRANPLDEIRNTREIEFVIQGGKILTP